LRKFWEDQKYTDKYLKTTFNRRDRDKMKTRKNKKNEMETVQKVIALNLNLDERYKRKYSKVFTKYGSDDEGKRNYKKEYTHFESVRIRS